MMYANTKKAIMAGCLFVLGAASAAQGQVAGDLC
jgi:hypothetical protein